MLQNPSLLLGANIGGCRKLFRPQVSAGWSYDLLGDRICSAGFVGPCQNPHTPMFHSLR